MFKRIALLACGLVLATACTAGPADTAATATSFTDGSEYVSIPNPQRAGKDGKVEVVEVFSYGCIHCAHYEEYAEKLQKELPKDVVFRSMPAAFNDAWLPYARAFYAAKKLSALDATHAALFKAIHIDHYPIRTIDELADWYASKGVDRAAFLREANSEATTKQIQADTKLIQQWQVDGTPSIVVDGKYRSNNFGDFDKLNALTQFLVKKELAGVK
ncbi:thiol:disulfide interchange protein DsbA [Luteibacter rhizovicinus]|uniref:Thiol:disulfide interchange protein DsbA n=1 Tax=Luteibacter rhizovicinus TaxID=242606 RepID=A0A4R3YT76_9GAMM|nr:thiol:disulfide interchange protein DsbA/DsbL [Luteibacter rhizovicinus]TCV96127.1 thiol:disulfide interchange protein DsbA [Luteibacter rhizovicinus]